MASSDIPLILRGFSLDADDRSVAFDYSVAGEDFRETFNFVSDSFSGVAGRVAMESAARLLYFASATSYFNLLMPNRIHVDLAIDEREASLLKRLVDFGCAETAVHADRDLPDVEIIGKRFEVRDPTDLPTNDRCLVAFSGGKDSFTSLAALTAVELEVDTVTLVPPSGVAPPVAMAMSGIEDLAGVHRYFVTRRFDTPRYLAFKESHPQAIRSRGHLPVTAINVLASCLQAVLSGHKSIVFSNERTASEMTTLHREVPVNHQWSKSLDAERMLAHAINQLVSPSIQYQNLLGDLSELGIVRCLVANSKHLIPFSCSCNEPLKTNATNKTWCGRCAKCLFVHLAFTSFMTRTEVFEALGFDPIAYWSERDVLNDYADILGMTNSKPWVCTGSIQEARVALFLSANNDPAGWQWDLYKHFLSAGMQEVTESDVQDVLKPKLRTPTPPLLTNPELASVLLG